MEEGDSCSNVATEKIRASTEKALITNLAQPFQCWHTL